MGFQVFPIIALLMVAGAATNAALNPQLYSKSMLPAKTMPKAISDLLRPEWMDQKFTSVGVDVGVEKGYGGSGTDVNVGVGYSPFNYLYTAAETQLHGDSTAAMFFLEKDLRRGEKMDLHFTKTSNAATFLPRRVADSIPFQLSKVEDIFNKFSVKQGSYEAQIMNNTINQCEERGISGKEKQCVTSLESMVDFRSSKLGMNVDAVSTESYGEAELRKYSIAPGVKALSSENKVVVCHKLFYLYAVFYCHKTKSIKAYYVPLDGGGGGDDGNRVKAVAVCHNDTSEWNPKHLAFIVLKVKPGTAPICHFLPEDHVLRVPK